MILSHLLPAVSPLLGVTKVGVFSGGLHLELHPYSENGLPFSLLKGV